MDGYSHVRTLRNNCVTVMRDCYVSRTASMRPYLRVITVNTQKTLLLAHSSIAPVGGLVKVISP